jgi:hypothetical protein
VHGITIHIDHIEQVTITGTPAPSVRWHVGPVVPLQGEPMPVEVTMSTEEQVRLSITPLTPGGDPAPTDGPAQWTIEGPCMLVPIDDLSTWVRGTPTAAGDSVVTVTADADLGEGFVPLADTAVIHVSSPMAASLGMQADAPVLIPE